MNDKNIDSQSESTNFKELKHLKQQGDEWVLITTECYRPYTSEKPSLEFCLLNFRFFAVALQYRRWSGFTY